MTHSTDVLVIGAGVAGLTTAICLAEAGAHVRVWAAEPPQETTSAVAGALWGPHLVEQSDRVRVWSQVTFEMLLRLAGDPATGVRLARGREYSRVAAPGPQWESGLDDVRACDPAELPDGFASGWQYTVPVLDMPVYLGYLQARLAESGVEIEQRRIDAVTEATDDAPTVINCTGIGAYDLLGDDELHPVRGQIVVVENPGLDEFVLGDTDGSELVYWFPHGDRVLLGGTGHDGAWDREPDPAVAEAIVARCAAIEPRLAGARVVGHRVGLRPARPRVRLEMERIGGVPVVHNYGHGGAGVTLSWGCAAQAAALAWAGLTVH